jgi:glycosyltransferase involved in cell wall biosynthesis
MKIAVIDPALFTWPYDAALLNGLLAGGHEVHFISKSLPPSCKKDSPAILHELFYPGLEHPLCKKLPRPLFLLLKGCLHFISYFRLMALLRRIRPDVIHFQWAPLPIIDLLFLPWLRRLAPLVLTVHDSSPFNNNPSARLQRLGAFRIMRAFDQLIVHTEKARQALQARGLRASRITRIAHGVLGAGPQVASTPAKTEGVMTVLLFGKLKPYKGADLLIRALAALPEPQRSRCRLQIVGKAEMDVEPLKTLAQELKVDSCIRWDLRFVDDAELAGIFANSDVVAMPYREIDASGVLMVALSIGRPILASRIGLFAELLEDGTHGLLVAPENPDALADAISRLLDNPAQREQMGANVRTLAAAIPSWEEIGQQTVQVYQKAG